MSMFNNRTKPGIQCFCLLSLLLALAFYDVVFLNKTFKVTTANSQALPHGAYGQLDNKPAFIPVNGTDSPVLEEPLYAFIKKHLWKGDLPLWNPHQACGYPLIGMIQLGLFFPLTFIMYLFPELYAWDILILSRLLFSGLFTYWFMRRMGFKHIPGLAAGLCFMLSGPMVLLQYWTVNVDMLLPLLLIAIDQIVRYPGRRSAGLLGLTFALTIFGGHPEHIFLVNVYGILFLIWRVFSLRKQVNIAKTALWTGIGYALGLFASAIIMLPFLRNLAGEFWSGHPDGTGLRMEEQAERFITLALPHFFQDVPLTYQWEFSGWWGGYIGLIPITLAVMSLFRRQKRGLNIFFAAMTFGIISKQYGLPFINWIGHLPIFEICRYAIHTPHLAAFSVAVLAGMGVRVIAHTESTVKKALFFVVPFIILIGVHLAIFSTADFFDLSKKAAFFAIGLLSAYLVILFLKDRRYMSRGQVGIILILLIFTELFSYIHRERPRRFESFGTVPYFEFLKSSPEHIRSYGIFWAFYPNTATGFGVDDLGYFLGLVPRRYKDFVNVHLMPDHFKDDLRPPALRAIPIQGRRHFLDLLNVRYIIAPEPERMETLLINFKEMKKGLITAYADEVSIFDRPSVFPRAYIVHRAVFSPDEEKSLLLVGKIGPQLRQVAVIQSPPIRQIAEALQGSPVTDQSEVRIILHEPDRVTMNVYMQNSGFLVLSDAYHPDWKVTVNGQPWKIFQTNHMLRSVFLPTGRFQVEMTFEPKEFFIGRWMTIFSILALFLLAFWPFPKRKTSQ